MLVSGVSSTLNFKAGKVHLYSDFDGTYCPTKHSSMHNPDANPQMPSYCNKMKDLFQKTEGDLNFHITTGRTFGEYESVMHLLKIRGYELPLPQTFIAKNGSDQYVRKDSFIDFYSIDGEFPFSNDRTNLVKEKNIENETGWNGVKIKDFVKELAKKYKLPIIEGDTENSVFDYGEKSLFSQGKLNINEWKNLPHSNINGEIKFIQHEKPVINYNLGLRNDGNLKLHFIYPPDYGYCKERSRIYENFMQDIKSYFNQNNIRANFEWEMPNKNNYYRTSCSITPELNGEKLTKMYDIREAIKKAKYENDMVVCAGDGLNDFQMLNPLEYLEKDFIETCRKNSLHKEFYDSDMTKKLEFMKKVLDSNNADEKIISLRKELESNGFLSKLKELPFCGIVIKKQDSALNLLVEVFEKLGKIIQANTGEIDVGIKEAIKLHANKDKDFKKNMSKSFRKFIMGGKRKEFNPLLLFLSSVTVLAGAYSSAMCIKVKEKSTNENIHQSSNSVKQTK